MSPESFAPKPEKVRFTDQGFSYGWMPYYNNGLPGRNTPSGYHFRLSFDTNTSALTFTSNFPDDDHPAPLPFEVGDDYSGGIESGVEKASILAQFARIVSETLPDRVDSYERVHELREALESKIRRVGSVAAGKIGKGGYKADYWDGVYQQVSELLQGFTL